MPDQNMTSYYEMFFDKEARSIEQLLSPNATVISSSENDQQATALPVPHHMYSQHINEVLNRPFVCSANCTLEKGLIVRDGDMSRPFVHTVSEAECCDACARQPVCIAWQFVQAEGCYLKSHLTATVAALVSNETLRDPRGTFGYFAQRQPLPRAVIMHGTTCIYRNDTIKFIKRDVNTIWIGRYMIERPSLTRSIGIDEFSVTSCASMVDEIWVPTAWHATAFKNIMQSQGFKTFPSIAVIEEAVDTSLFDPSPDCDNCPGADSYADSDPYPSSGLWLRYDKEHPFVFLSVFKWEYRKGWDVLLDSYWNAFESSDPVELHVHTYLPATERGSANIYHHMESYAQQHFGLSLSQLPRVVWINSALNASSVDEVLPAAARTEHALVKSQITLRRYSRMNMREILRAADAFVLPTRGEGWGLPIAEAMSMALPVIVTNCSGILAYAREENAFLIPVLEEADSLGYAQPDARALSGIMRQVAGLAIAGDGITSPEVGVEVGGFESVEVRNITEATGEVNLLRLKGRKAREKMKEISPQSVVKAIEVRLRHLASLRGWNL